MSEGYAKWRVNVRRLLKTGEARWHKQRVPGQVRLTRMKGGSGYRNHPHYGRKKERACGESS